MTWSTTTISDGTLGSINDNLGPAISRFDPSIAFDANGNLYIAYGHRSSSGFKLIVAKSTDGGASFSQFTTVDGSPVFLDKWHLATGPDGPGSNNQAIYVAYTERVLSFPVNYMIMVAGSNDGGASFTAPVPVSAPQSVERVVLFADPAVGPAGELYVSWHDIDLGRIYVDSDLDGLFTSSNTFGTDVLVKETEVTLDQRGVPAAPNRGIHTGPVLDVDRSGGGFHGRLYLTWVDAVDATSFDSNKNSDIYLAWSDDHGANGTWTIPALPGNVGNVEDSIGTDFLPWIDVDQITGSVNVLYYTSDGDQGIDDRDNDDVHVRLATSIDGGQSFTYATMSRQMSNEQGGHMGDYHEYIGLAVHGGTAHALWASRLQDRIGTPQESDLEALYASASLLSVQGDNVLYITGDDSGATNDTIELKRSTANAAYLEVWVNGNRQYTGLMASINVIDITALGGGDDIFIDADIDADFIVHGGAGDDDLTLRGKSASLLGNFEFQGNDGNDTLIVKFLNGVVNGEALPRPGFEFNFNLIDDADQENVSVIDTEGTHVGFFVNSLTDATDAILSDGRADSSSTTIDDQTTLRAAIQQSNFTAGKNYIFLPSGTNLLSVTGTGGDLQGDLDITSSVVIMGTGAGLSVVDASGFGTTNRDRVFDVLSGATLSLSRLTLSGGHTRTATGKHGGAIQVGNGGTLVLDQSALVDNLTETGGHGGGIYFAASGAGTITRSVITTDHADGTSGGIYLGSSAPGAGGLVSMTSTIIVNNSDEEGISPDVFASGNRTFTSGGKNRFGNETTGLVHDPTGNGDYMGTADYVVTSVADTYDGDSDLTFMSLRDAIHQSNTMAGTQEIWLPAWNFILTLERIADEDDPELDISQGDLEVSDSLRIRGILNATTVVWRAGAALDKTFELVGDYDNDGISSPPSEVGPDDYTVWSKGLLAADGDDDGDVDQDDYYVWFDHYGTTLMLFDIP